MCSFLLALLSTLEDASSLDIELVGHIRLKIADPLVVAGQESTILLLNGGKGLEGRTRVALLILKEMLGHVVTHKTLQQVQLEIVLLIELVACDGLRIGVVIVCVAFVGESLH